MRCPICLNYTHQCGVTRRCEPYEDWVKKTPGQYGYNKPVVATVRFLGRG